MERKGAKISSCIVRMVAEKLKKFIEDHETTFKFQHWQMTSTLDVLRKTIHRGLHERAIHYLWDTGTAREIVNFSKKKKSSMKVQEVVDYLYSFIGINISQVNKKPITKSLFTKQSSKENKTTTTYKPLPERNFSKNPVEERIFEIKKLVESVAQELAYLFALTDENSNSTQYSWKVSRYHMTSVKKQKLACCSYPSCLFNIRKQHWYKEHKAVRQKIKKSVPIKNVRTNIHKYKQSRLTPRAIVQTRTENQQKDPTSVQKTQMKFPARKLTANIATQTTSWKQDRIPSYESSSYQDTLKRICGEEDSYDEEEEEYYCKSDTLNDASMITEEIASEFDVENRLHPPNQNKFESDSKVLNVLNVKQRRKSSTSTDHRSQKNSNAELSNVSPSNVNSVKYSNCASNKRKSFGNSKDFAQNQLTIQQSKSKSSNVSSRSKTKSIKSVKEVSKNKGKNEISSQISNSKSGSSRKEKQKMSITDKQEKLNSFSEKSERKLHEKQQLQPEKELNSANETSKNNITVVLESPDLANEFDIEEVKKLSKVFNRFEENGAKETSNILPVATSSDNETTYLPVVSSSDNASAAEENSKCTSSAKEDDNLSPEYSSHWTEEISSTEMSESVADESFKKKFIPYKRSLLDEDDGMVASGEGDTASSGDSEDSQEDSVIHEMILDAILTGDIEKFRQLAEKETELLKLVDEKGWNLLHFVTAKGIVLFLKELLNCGVPIESRTHDGYTPLKLAITYNRLDCCKVLLQNGASLIKTDGTFDKEVLEMAASSPIKTLLIKYDENLGRLKMISDVLNHFGGKKNASTLISKDLLKSLADLTLEEDETLVSSGVS